MSEIFTTLQTTQSSLKSSQLLDIWPDPSETRDHSGNAYHGIPTSAPVTASTGARPNFFAMNGTTSKIDLSAHMAAFQSLGEGTNLCPVLDDYHDRRQIDAAVFDVGFECESFFPLEHR